MTIESASVAERLLEHCMGIGLPTQDLLNHGRFPEGWVDKYLALVQEAKHEYADQPLWPREFAASAYLVSVYCDKRYRDYLRGGGAEDAETEIALRRVRWAGDDLLFGWFNSSLGLWSLQDRRG
jgi:hypothetical protein